MFRDNLFRELIIDNFAGGGGASVGIELALGAPVDIAVNHDESAIAMHTVNHPYTEHFREDVFAIDPEKVTGGRPVGIAWFSPDCFEEGTLVLTANDGYKPIEQINVGDMVFTHKLRWRTVTAVMKTMRNEMIIKGYGHNGIHCSTGHPFYIKHCPSVWDNTNRRYVREHGDVEWKKAENLEEDDYWGCPEQITELPIPELKKDNNKGIVLPVDERLLWLAGRYTGDGWTRLTDTRAEIVIICGIHEVEYLKNKLDMWPRNSKRCKDGELHWNFRRTRTGGQFTANSRSLVNWLRENFGHKAPNKTMPSWLYGAPVSFRLAFLEGYLGADGCKIENLTEASTISKKLAFGLRTLSATLGFSPTVYVSKQNNVIEGRKVNAKQIYKVKWRDEVDDNHRQTFSENNILWAPIRSAVKTGKVKQFYNISVDEDESYVAEGIIVHNCKHFSRAKGGKPVSRNIRGLSWVVLRWAMAGRSAPRVIFMENVPEIQTWGPLKEVNGELKPDPAHAGETFNGFIAMLTTGIDKSHPAFAEACEFLKLDPGSAEADRLAAGLGYNVEHRELKACDYGAPTIRKRFYLVARRDGKPIVFPEPTHGKGKGLKPYRTTAECIDWSLPCPSIFNRKKPLAPNTLRRIARGLDKFVIKNPRPYIMSNNTGNVPKGIDEPLPTITTGIRNYLCTPTVTKFQQNSLGQSPDKPLDTVMAGAPRFGAVAPSLIQYHTEQSSGEVRGQKIDKPAMTVDGSNRYAINAAYLTKYFSGEQQSGASLEEPAPTVTAIDHTALVTGSIVKYYSGAEQYSSLDEPLHTVTTKDRHGLAASHLGVFRKNTDGKDLNEPMPTLTTSAGHMAHIKTYFEKIDGAENLGHWDEVRELLNTYAGYTIADDEVLLFEINGTRYYVADIGLRMLKAHELMLAQGFPPDYIIDIEPYIGKPYSEAKQIARLGNAVCPPVATALIRANCADMAVCKRPIKTMAQLNKILSAA